MKKPTVLTILACALSAFSLQSASAAVIAYWDFNNGFAVANNSVQITHTASVGNGVLYQQRADTDGNGKTGTVFSGEGITSVSGVAMAWDDVAKSGDNDAEFFVVFSAANFSNVVVSFDIRGNANGGIVSYDLKYALTGLVNVTNPTPEVVGTVKDFAGGLSTGLLADQPITTSTAFTRITLNLSTLTANAVDNQAVVALRFDDWESNDAMSIDNLLITGTAIPEPSSLALFGGVAIIGLLRRRR
jgi:uncharacterized protein YbjQ (UPF0145 family)